MDELKALEMIRNEFEDVIITPRMTFEELLEYAKKKYHLIPCMCRDLGLSDIYTDFLAEKELSSYTRQNGIEIRQDTIRWHVFKVPYPEIIAGFLYHAHGPAEYWGITHLIFEESTGFIHSNYDVWFLNCFTQEENHRMKSSAMISVIFHFPQKSIWKTCISGRTIFWVSLSFS